MPAVSACSLNLPPFWEHRLPGLLHAAPLFLACKYLPPAPCQTLRWVGREVLPLPRSSPILCRACSAYPACSAFHCSATTCRTTTVTPACTVDCSALTCGFAVINRLDCRSAVRCRGYTTVWTTISTVLLHLPAVSILDKPFWNNYAPADSSATTVMPAFWVVTGLPPATVLRNGCLPGFWNGPFTADHCLPGMPAFHWATTACHACTSCDCRGYHQVFLPCWNACLFLRDAYRAPPLCHIPLFLGIRFLGYCHRLPVATTGMGTCTCHHFTGGIPAAVQLTCHLRCTTCLFSLHFVSVLVTSFYHPTSTCSPFQFLGDARRAGVHHLLFHHSWCCSHCICSRTTCVLYTCLHHLPPTAFRLISFLCFT